MEKVKKGFKIIFNISLVIITSDILRFRDNIFIKILASIILIKSLSYLFDKKSWEKTK